MRKSRAPMIKPALAITALLLFAIGVKAWHDTMREPVVMHTKVVLSDLPNGSPQLNIALISDIHIAGPDMPPERLEKIVSQINALKPDLVAIAGDLVSEKRTATRLYQPAEIVAPLSKLIAPLGVVVVPGNHDHWYDWPGLLAGLNRHKISVLANEVAQIGPLAFAGLDDDFTGRADLNATHDALKGLDGPRIMLSHSPDPFPDTPSDVALFLAGHTHCGQIAYPWGGAPASLSKYGNRYACGRVDEGGKTIITGAGLGTSLLPLRLFTQPEIWLIEVAPKETATKPDQN